MERLSDLPQAFENRIAGRMELDRDRRFIVIVELGKAKGTMLLSARKRPGPESGLPVMRQVGHATCSGREEPHGLTT
ncbi:MAG: hypothetical protein R3E35_06645 [Rhodocyclaceae bacterium]|jgi:hypothetical protein